jgi:hypothetical protein
MSVGIHYLKKKKLIRNTLVAHQLIFSANGFFFSPRSWYVSIMTSINNAMSRRHT